MSPEERARQLVVLAEAHRSATHWHACCYDHWSQVSEGYSYTVDWGKDPQLDRRVGEATAILSAAYLAASNTRDALLAFVEGEP